MLEGDNMQRKWEVGEREGESRRLVYMSSSDGMNNAAKASLAPQDYIKRIVRIAEEKK